MVHEINFLVAAGGDFHGANEPDVLIGDEVLAESAFVSAITEKMRNG